MASFRNLKFVQHNITSIRPSDTRKALKNFLSINNIDIALLQEIWIKPNEEYKFNGYKFVKLSRQNGYGGVGILVRNEITFQEFALPDLNPLETIAIKTLNTENQILIISIYIPPPPVRNQDIKEPLKKLIELIEQTKLPTIFAGDFNAHNQIWNPKQNNCPRGELLENLLQNTVLVNLNDGSPTLIKSPNTTPSTIDLTFASSDIAHKINWNIHFDEIMSNHRIITFEIINSAKKYDYKIECINKTKAIESINNIDLETIEDQHNILPVIKEKIDESKYTRKSNRNPKSWWNKDIEEQLKVKNNYLIQYFRNQTHENLMLFKKAKAKLKQMIRKASRNDWNKLIESINPDMKCKELWNIVKRISGGFPSKNNIHLLNDETLALKFVDNNFPEIDQTLKYNITLTEFNPNITCAELNKIIHSKKDTSAPGIDGLSFQILKNLNINWLIKITEVLNIVLKTGDIPEDWREIKIVPILKQSKDPSKAESYRPISMLCVLLKLINFVVKKLFTNFLNKEKLLPPYSFGFKQKTSAVNCVNALISHIKQAKRDNEVVIATFLDLTKAFDNVSIAKLLEILNNINTPPELSNWIYQYLRKRKIILKLANGKEIIKTTNKGLPQGCPLSPVLFNVYTMKIHSLADYDRIFFQYADDFTAVVIAKTITEAEDKMNNFLNQTVNALNELDMVINPDKCATVIFTNKFHPTTNITINNTLIEINPFHKFLGIIIDHRLNYNKHVEHCVTKAKRKINILKMITKRKNGAHPETALRIAKAIVQPHLDYGLTISADTSKTSFSKLETTQHLYIRTAMRYLKSTPNHVILAETGELPLKDRAEYLALKEISKNIYHNSSPIVQFLNRFIHSDEPHKHSSYLEKTANINNFHLLQLAIPMPNDPASNLIVKSEIANLTKKNIPTSTQKQMVLDLIRSQYSDKYLIYTDGSKINDRTGYGVYDSQEKISYSGRLKTQFTIMNAELAAILKAIEHIIEQNIEYPVILTDSKSATELLKQKENTENYLINEINHRINLYKKTIIIQWIPGHIGLLGNDRADLAAKLGNNMNQIAELKLTKSDLLLNIKKETYCIWNQRYKTISQEKGKYHFQISQNINHKPWFENVNLPTDLTIILSRIRTGHTATKDRLYSWKLVNSDKCEICNTTENLTHILHHCPRFHLNRQKYPILTNHSDIAPILAENKTENIKQIAEFLREIKVNV